MNPAPANLSISRPAADLEAAEWEMVVPTMTRPSPTPRLEPEIESTPGEPPRRSLRALTIFWLLILALTAAAVIFLKTHV